MIVGHREAFYRNTEKLNVFRLITTNTELKVVGVVTTNKNKNGVTKETKIVRNEMKDSRSEKTKYNEGTGRSMMTCTAESTDKVE